MKYDGKAWESRQLEKYYADVGWAFNRRHTVGLITMLDHETLLDVGCLDGTYIKRLRELGYKKHYIGVDITKRHVEIASKNNPHETFKVADARQLPFSNCEFDLVLFSDVIQHLDDAQGALAEVCRVSSKYVILSTYGTPAKSFQSNSAKFINSYFTRKAICRILPKEYFQLAFFDLPHPTFSEHDMVRRIYHFVFKRR